MDTSLGAILLFVGVILVGWAIFKKLLRFGIIAVVLLALAAWLIFF